MDGETSWQMWANGSSPTLYARVRDDTDTGGDSRIELDYDVTTGGASSWIGDGKWHMIAVTLEEGGSGNMYIDGILRKTEEFSIQDSLSPYTQQLAIGANNNDGILVDFFKGQLDELEVYNYVMPLQDIREKYRGGGGFICENAYADWYDVDSNCRIDFVDFAAFAAAWLDSGL